MVNGRGRGRGHMGRSLRTPAERERGSLGLIKGVFISLGGRCIFLSCEQKEGAAEREPAS